MVTVVLIVFAYVAMLVMGLTFLIIYSKNRTLKYYIYFGILSFLMGLYALGVSQFYLYTEPDAVQKLCYLITLASLFIPAISMQLIETLLVGNTLKRFAFWAGVVMYVTAGFLTLGLIFTDQFFVLVASRGQIALSPRALYIGSTIVALVSLITGTVLITLNWIRYRTIRHAPYGPTFVIVNILALIVQIAYFIYQPFNNLFPQPPVFAELPIALRLNVGVVLSDMFIVAGFFSIFLRHTRKIFTELSENRSAIEQLLLKTRANTGNMINTLVKALEQRDPVTAAHSRRVADYAKMLASVMSYPKSGVELIYTGALLHDIGKIGIADDVLHKLAKLTREELDTIRMHPLIGTEIVSHIDDFLPILDIIQSHHERIDGNGYPEGLRGDAIPEMARIIAVCDTYDAITSDVYKEPLSHDAACRVLLRCRGTQLDASIAELFVKKIIESAAAAPAAGTMEQHV